MKTFDIFPATIQGLKRKGKSHRKEQSLVRVLRLGGAKRRFILAAAKHRCGACEAQKRPAGPIVGRSPNSFVFNDVVGLDLFFLNHPRKTHSTCHEHRVLGHWIAACCSPSRQVGRGPHIETTGCDQTEGRASFSSISSAACAQAFLQRKFKATEHDLK